MGYFDVVEFCHRGMTSAISSVKLQQLLCRLRCTLFSCRHLSTPRRIETPHRSSANRKSTRSNRSNHRAFGIHEHQIYSFCSQTKQQREDEIPDPKEEIETISPCDSSIDQQEEQDDDEYEYEYEYDDEEDSEE